MAPTPGGGAQLDVLCLGRIGVDLYPLQTGVGLEDVDTFGKFLGGSPTNVAVAVARLGHRVSLLTGVGDDPFGRFARRELRRYGVDDGHVVVVPELHTPVAFCEIFPPDHFPLWFYRSPSAPDLQLRPEDVPADLIAGARLLWLTVTGLSAQPSLAAHEAALAARAGGHTVLDLDYRPMFWTDPAAAGERVRAALASGSVTVAVGNLEECRVAVGETDPDRAADALLEAGVDVAIVKQGPRGVLGRTREERVWVPATPIEVVNGLGAGDGFGGALCHGLLEGWSLGRALEFASAAGAHVAGHLECAGAMPTVEEVERLLEHRTPAATEPAPGTGAPRPIRPAVAGASAVPGQARGRA